jgi:hypothetical protein
MSLTRDYVDIIKGGDGEGAGGSQGGVGAGAAGGGPGGGHVRKQSQDSGRTSHSAISPSDSLERSEVRGVGAGGGFDEGFGEEGGVEGQAFQTAESGDKGFADKGCERIPSLSGGGSRLQQLRSRIQVQRFTHGVSSVCVFWHLQANAETRLHGISTEREGG